MSCEIAEIGYGDFSKRIHDYSVAHRTPIKGSIEITARCNLRCAHCYIEGVLPPSQPELTTDEWRNILDQLAEEGCLWLLITGGEPLMRPDFREIYSHAKSKGFFITLFSNATLLTPEMADFLVELPPLVLDVSIYGATKKTYESVTGIRGSFQRAMRGIDLALERGLPLKLKSMILTLNKHEALQMKEFAKSHGIKFRYDTILNARLDGTDKPFNVRLTPREILDLDLADEDRCRELEQFCETLWGSPGTDLLYTCGGSGRVSFNIDAYGELGLCTLSREPHYDLRQGTFHDGFYNAFPPVYERRRTRPSKCQTCPMVSLCGQCPGWSELEFGDPEARSEFLCELAHLRAATFKKRVAGMAGPK